LVGAAIGFIVGSVSYNKDRTNNLENNATINITALIRGVVKMAMTASVSYWYIQFLKNERRRIREEKDARQFFSKKSASGNKY
jgi:TRAP-type C4-dicarboxylate transport system permease small subunit